jgi:hypothetical protein
MNYFDDPAHATWRYRYLNGEYHNAKRLGFTEAWRNANLPPSGTHDGLRYTLFDAERNIVLPEMKIYTAFEHHPVSWGVMDQDWNTVDCHALQGYFYGAHHCPCHRKTDAKRFIPDLDEECEGFRFRIQSIYVPGHPELVLYSETIPEEELEAALDKLRQEEVGR